MENGELKSKEEENIGNGEKVTEITSNPSTGESLEACQTTEKQSMKKTKKSITKEEAVEILTSTLEYCRTSGLIVMAYNEKMDLVLYIKGVNHVQDQVVLSK